MKLMNRFLAFSLGLLLTLHSFSLPAWANSGEDSVITIDDIVPESNYQIYCDLPGVSYSYVINGDYLYVFDSDGILFSSSTFFNLLDDSSGDEPGDPVLTDGTIADAIATGVGIYYNSDAGRAGLGTLLMDNLQAATEGRTLGRTQFESWLSWAQQGTIKLESAPSWIYETIMDTMYDVYSGDRLPVVSLSSTISNISNSIVYSGSPVFVGYPQFIDGLVSRSYYLFEHDFVPVVLTNTTDFSGNFYSFFGILDTTIYSSTFNAKPSYSFFNAITGKTSTGTLSSNNRLSIPVDGGYLCYWLLDTSVLTASYMSGNPIYRSLYFDNVVPGSYSTTSTSGSVDMFSSYFQSYVNGIPVTDGFNSLPEPAETPPDAMFGGIVKLWQDGVAASAIKLPDINLGDRTSADVSALTQQVNDGTITWTDYWTQVAGKVPSVDIGDGIYNIEDDGLGDTFLGESEDTTVKGIFALLGDLFAKLTGSAEDRNEEIDGALPGMNDELGRLDSIESGIRDQFNDAFGALDLEGFKLTSGVLTALSWLTGYIIQFFNISGEAQVIILLPMFLGLALLFIGRGFLAMTRVRASQFRVHHRNNDKGGGTS